MIPFKSKLARLKVEKRNEKFKNLNEVEQRREVAYDALNLVLKKKVAAAAGFYWSDSIHTLTKNCSSSKLQSRLLESLPKQNECAVCQRGLIMLSMIRVSDGLNSFRGTDGLSQGIDQSMRKSFSYDSFEDMEQEYENSMFSHPYLKKSTHKLANICCNIIANGNFDHMDATDYLRKWRIFRKVVHNTIES